MTSSFREHPRLGLPRDFPWRALCELQIEFANGDLVAGTGWLASRRAVVTTARNLFDHDGRGRARKVHVSPAVFDGGLVRRSTSTTFRYPEQWETNPDVASDYAVVILDEDRDEPLTVGRFPDEALSNVPVTIVGCPSGSHAGGVLYEHALAAVSIFDDRFAYVIDPYDGQSGSPILVGAPGNLAVAGMHTNGSGTLNFGVRLTAKIADDLQAWCS